MFLYVSQSLHSRTTLQIQMLRVLRHSNCWDDNPWETILWCICYVLEYELLNSVILFLISQECIDPLWYINWLISQVYQLIKLTCNVHGSTNKSPIKLSMQQKLNWHGDLFTNRENLHGKNPTGVFKVITLENPLLSKQPITSKGILVPYTNL